MERASRFNILNKEDLWVVRERPKKKVVVSKATKIAEAAINSLKSGMEHLRYTVAGGPEGYRELKSKSIQEMVALLPKDYRDLANELNDAGYTATYQLYNPFQGDDYVIDLLISI